MTGPRIQCVKVLLVVEIFCATQAFSAKKVKHGNIQLLQLFR